MPLWDSNKREYLPLVVEAVKIEGQFPCLVMTRLNLFDRYIRCCSQLWSNRESAVPCYPMKSSRTRFLDGVVVFCCGY